jgi:hypothetical protein
MPTPKFKLPSSLAGAADKLYTLRAERLALQKEVDAMGEQESALREFIIQNLPKSQASGITGRIAHAEIEKKIIPQVNDWPAFYRHVLKTKDFSLMQRRLNDGAVKERWTANKAVPGVGKFTALVVSVTKK